MAFDENDQMAEARQMLADLAESRGHPLRGDETPAELLDLLDAPTLPPDALEALAQALERIRKVDEAVR